jgi:hypothetical protein
MNDSHIRDKFQWVIVDIDEAVDLYGHLRRKRTINAIPAFLRYDGDELVPDDVIIGSDLGQLKLFFQRSYNKTL